MSKNPVKIELNYLEYEDLIWIIQIGLWYIEKTHLDTKINNDISVRYNAIKHFIHRIRNQHG